MIIFICICVLATIVVAEIFVKKQAEKKLDDEFCLDLDPAPIKLHKLHNYGMAGSTLKEKPEVVKLLGVLVMIALIIGFIIVLFIKGRNGLKIGFALLVGGGLSNLLDRFTKGYVTDYFSFKTPFARLNRLVFNLSDLCIFVGAIVVVLSECLKGAE